MSNAQKQVEAVIEIDEPRFIHTKWAVVAVYGWKHIGESLLETVAMALNLPFWEEGDHGVRYINFSTDKPQEYDKKTNKWREVFGHCWADGNGMLINLGHHFDQGCRRTQSTQRSASVYSYFVYQLMSSVLHEMHHMGSLAGNHGKIPDNSKVDEEEAAEDFAREAICELAKTFDIEPPEWVEVPFFFNRWNDCSAEDNLGEWLDHQKYMLDNRLFFCSMKDEGSPIKYHTLKDYIHALFSGADPADETWQGEPIPVPSLVSINANLATSLPSVETTTIPVGGITEAKATMQNELTTIAVAFGGAGTGIEPMAGSVIPSIPLPVPEGDVSPCVGSASAEEFTEDDGGENGFIDDNIQPLMDTPVTTQSVPNASGAQVVQAQIPVGNPGISAPPVQSTPQALTYPATTLTNQEVINMVTGLYHKIYNHIFSYCGQSINSDLGFSHPSKVYELPIELDTREAEVVVKMDCLDANGRWCSGMPSAYELNGVIKARIVGAQTKNTGLPYYKLYINNNGVELTRMLLPQNPGKQVNGQYTKPALAARSGSRILYIMEGNDALVAQGAKKFIGKIVDGELQIG